MKLLKKHFLIKIDKVQIKQINKRCSVRISTLIDKQNYNHYFFYCPDFLLPAIEKSSGKFQSAKIYTATNDDISKSKGKLFKYNVLELYLDDGKIIAI
jgi:tRNA A37 threonylcarbamoyladenosine dehydratase